MTSTTFAARDGTPSQAWRCGSVSRTARGRWTTLNIALMVVGFVVFWPLGLAMLAYILWGDRIRERMDDLRAKGGPAAAFGLAPSSGNHAFDEYRAATLRRLEEERRRLEEEQEEFAAFVRELRRAKDKEEFDRFMAERNARRSGDSTVA